MLRSQSFQLVHNDKELEPKAKFPILKGSFGADIYVLAKDREILTNPEETKRRRAIRLMRNNLSTWGFTLQTYGIRNKRTEEVEIMTYVDYVELHSPAWIAGMQCGDIILSVNGESVDNLSHHDLVNKIKKCGTDLRLVVLFENCCSKVALQERYLKLKKLLKLKLKELYYLEKEEIKLKGGILLSQSYFLKPSNYSSIHSELKAYPELTDLNQYFQPSVAKFDLVSSESSSASSSLSSGISKKICSSPTKTKYWEKETVSYDQDYKMKDLTAVNDKKTGYNISKDYSFNELIYTEQLDRSNSINITGMMNVSDNNNKLNLTPELYNFDISEHHESHFVQRTVKCCDNLISGLNSDESCVLCKSELEEKEKGNTIFKKQSSLESHSESSKHLLNGFSSQILLHTDHVFNSRNVHQLYLNPDILNEADVQNSSSTGTNFEDGVLVNDITLSTRL